MDKSGREVIYCKYDYAYDFHEGFAVVQLNRKIGLINTQGKEIIPFIFDTIEIIDSVIMVGLNYQYGVINYNGEYILPCQYDDIKVFNKRIIAKKSKTNYEFNLSGELLNIRNLEDANFYWVF